MKKFLAIFFLLVGFSLQAQKTWYVDDDGSDITGDGTSGNPWKTISYAIGEASGVGKIFIYPGTYPERSMINHPVNISLEGFSKDQVRVESSLGAASDPLFKLETSTGWLGTYGNQTISGITFDGNNMTYSCFHVNFRSNVVFLDCDFVNFTYNAITLYGMEMASWGATSVFEPDRTMPEYFCTGN